MNYDYKVINADPAKGFVRRVATYIALLLFVVGLATLVLLLLFERYLSLFISAGFLLASFAIWFFVGRRAVSYGYHFTEEVIEIERNGANFVHIKLKDMPIMKNAEKSDFFDKSIINLCFIHSRIISKNAVKYNNLECIYKVIDVDSCRYLLAFDEYALSLIGRNE
ncbi:MAG: hypothetical protein IJT91_09155 [Clostridia bacterium]|nr:hypothetical protein [Clostridia bacterium]